MDITIIDYEVGNKKSIQNLITRIGYSSNISSNHAQINRADKLILPGVGSFSYGIKNLIKNNLVDILRTKVLIDKTPILGICLGMQLFSDWSEEGDTAGLGWIPGDTIKFKNSDINSRHKIPHIGWNSLNIINSNSIMQNIDKNSLFYFAHSYHFKCSDKNCIVSTTQYSEKFVSSVQRENIFGTQFHPEKSHKFGIQILKNFIEL